MNRLLAQLDRRLDRRGELIDLKRTVGTTVQSFVSCRIPAIVRSLGVQQLIGNVTQTNYFLIISPTHINLQQWPGGKTAVVPSISLPSDPRIPLTTDSVVLRGAAKQANRVAPIFDRGECIRIELYVLG
jgi:hypothetical protein